MTISKLKIARSFSRAAITYDSVAYLQREIGQKLLAMLPAQIIQPVLHRTGALVDLGCGTGHFSNHLKSLYAHAAYIGVDIAEGMLRYARDQQLSLFHWLCADAERLPLGDNTVDCFFSNLTLQWCSNLAAVFTELMRSLKPGGYISFSTLGPATLRELRAAWLQVDHFIHVNEFYPADYWHAAIEDAGLQVQTHSIEIRTLQYGKISELMRELKTLGAHNMNTGQRQTLSGYRRIRQLHQAYEHFRKQSMLPATYEVYYWLLHKPLKAVDPLKAFNSPKTLNPLKALN